jgi:hypothetical protein
MHKCGAAPSHIAPSLQVVAVRALLSVNRDVLGGRGDVRFGENGGNKDADVGVDVAGVVYVGFWAGRLDENVGAVAVRLKIISSVRAIR